MAVQPQPPLPTTPAPTPKQDAPGRPVAVSAQSSPALGLGLLLTGLPGLIVWQYLVPGGWQSAFFGFNPRALPQFQQHLCLPALPALRPDAWAGGFRVLLLTVWAGYAFLVLGGLKGRLPKTRVVVGAMITVSLTLAVFCPALLTTDVYAYAAYAHLHVQHGLNPYLTSPFALDAYSDPVTHYLAWNIPTVYGPVWTDLSDLIVRLCPGSLWGQVALFKVVAAFALWGAAWVGSALAERFEPGRGRLALLAIGLNPLLLLEGPGNGHNDLLMTALALSAALLFLRKNYALAGLILGLSAGIKLITVALLPWMIWEAWRSQAGRERLSAILGLTAGTLLPLVLGYLPFWHGAATFGALQVRSQTAVDAASLARNLRFGTWLIGHGVPPEVASLLMAVRQNSITLLLYLGLTLWLGRAARGEARWLTCWALLAAFLMSYGMGMPLPWYMAWFWPVALLRWDRFHRGLSAMCLVVSFLLTYLYTCSRPVAL